MSPAIQHPAPAFTVTALIDGAFKEVSLSDYLGQWCVHFLLSSWFCCF
jgi:peroxiredoxin (alkyl hydroperoxide reductase subunit C)